MVMNLSISLEVLLTVWQNSVKISMLNMDVNEVVEILHLLLIFINTYSSYDFCDQRMTVYLFCTAEP